MKSYADHASHVLLGLTLGVLAMSSGLWTPAHAGSAVGKVTVMDVDEVREELGKPAQTAEQQAAIASRRKVPPPAPGG